MTSQRPNERIDAATIDANQCYDAVVGGDACAERGQQASSRRARTCRTFGALEERNFARGVTLVGDWICE